MNKLFYIFIDAFVSFFIILLSLGFVIDELKVKNYFIALIIITMAISILMLYLLNKTIIKKIRNSQKKIENEEKILEDNKEPVENIQEKEDENTNNNEEIKIPKLSRKLVNILTGLGIAIPSIIFIKVMSSMIYRPNLVLFFIGLFIFIGIIFFIVNWHSKYIDKLNEYKAYTENKTDTELEEKEEVNNVAEETSKNKENNIKEINQDEGFEPEAEKQRSRIIIKDSPIREPVPKASDGNNILNYYSDLGHNQKFVNISDTDNHLIYQRMMLFSPEIKDNIFFRYNYELFLQRNDKDYSHPRVTEKDLLRPDQIMIIEEDEDKEDDE